MTFKISHQLVIAVEKSKLLPMKLTKYVITALVGIILFLLILPWFIPQKAYLGLIIKELEEKYPVDVEFTEAKLSFLPTPNVEMKNVIVTLMAKEDYLSPLIKAQKVKIRTPWSGLLTKVFPLDTTFQNGTIQINEIEKGTYNFTTLLNFQLKQSKKKTNTRIIPKSLTLQDMVLTYHPLKGEIENNIIKNFKLYHFNQTEQIFSANFKFDGKPHSYSHVHLYANGKLKYNLQKKHLQSHFVNFDLDGNNEKILEEFSAKVSIPEFDFEPVDQGE